MQLVMFWAKKDHGWDTSPGPRVSPVADLLLGCAKGQVVDLNTAHPDKTGQSATREGV